MSPLPGAFRELSKCRTQRVCVCACVCVCIYKSINHSSLDGNGHISLFSLKPVGWWKIIHMTESWGTLCTQGAINPQMAVETVPRPEVVTLVLRDEMTDPTFCIDFLVARNRFLGLSGLEMQLVLVPKYKWLIHVTRFPLYFPQSTGFIGALSTSFESPVLSKCPFIFSNFPGNSLLQALS